MLALGIVLGYLAGSIPVGPLFARARGIDLRAVGSGNIGATNAARALGRRFGLLVFVCDAAKGAAPVLLALSIIGEDDGGWSVAAVGAAAFLGHLFPIWLRFRGGKGVATAFGVFAAIAPLPALAATGVFLATYAITRLSSLGSLLAVTVFLPLGWLSDHTPAHAALAAFLWILIVLRHRGNIGRLLRGEEHAVGKR